MSQVTRIFVAPKRGAPMQSVASAVALANRGLRGDRYANAKNRRSADYQLTLIESEYIEAFARSSGLALTLDMPRRNLVTQGVRLNELCGERFTVGDVIVEGVRLCEPCGLFAKRTFKEVLRYFVHKGGLRARILSEGSIHVGDRILKDA
jgi:MOSC domain-containing protein YiiM